MDNLKPTTPGVSELKIAKPASKLLPVLLGFAVIIILGLAAALWWCWYKPGTPLPPAGGEATTAATGPCFEGALNDLPADYSWYENAELGYKFAYPTAWGEVTVATDPTGGVSGHYVSGSFASNENVFFGGNSTDYAVMGRGGMYTDLPGYLEAAGKFYTVKIWKYNDGATTEPQYDLYPIDFPTTRKAGCNTHVAVTLFPHDDFMGYAADVAHVNLQPTNVYYGVNLVLKNPTTESRADLDKVIRSFQLIP